MKNFVKFSAVVLFLGSFGLQAQEKKPVIDNIIKIKLEIVNIL